MEVEKIMEIEHPMEHKDYASKGTAGTGLGLR